MTKPKIACKSCNNILGGDDGWIHYDSILRDRQWSSDVDVLLLLLQQDTSTCINCPGFLSDTGSASNHPNERCTDVRSIPVACILSQTYCYPFSTFGQRILLCPGQYADSRDNMSIWSLSEVRSTVSVTHGSGGWQFGGVVVAQWSPQGTFPQGRRSNNLRRQRTTLYSFERIL